LQRLATERAAAYERVVEVARQADAGVYEKMISLGLVSAIEENAVLGRQAGELAMEMIRGPIRVGHVPFGTDLALCGLVYDLCYPVWTEAEREAFHGYLNQTVDANVESEPHVFHNGWYGYKHWGYGIAAYACYYENPRAQQILQDLYTDYCQRAAPALELAGAGGGWAEGYYIHYFLYEWLFFCEIAHRCEGVDYFAHAPSFYQNRAVASLFEMYPGIQDYQSRRPIPMGDGGGRRFGGDRDKALSARRILVNRYRDDAAHQAVHTFNETTPRSSVGTYAYKDFLWRDPSVAKGDLQAFRLSHVSPGPGYVYARSSWDEDATYFFFKCGDRFTAHQHLDVGHFLIAKHGELIGDGGHYDEFGSDHDVNYHLRTIAHNSILIKDLSETWEGIRAGRVTGNDGGQAHAWPHHNGAVADAQAWQGQKALYDIADLLATEEHGKYFYVAGDASQAYSPNKLEYFTRQIVYLRPGTFVIFDRVKSIIPDYKKTFLLQAIKTPEMTEKAIVVTNGLGRLFIQPLLPTHPEIRLVSGEDLYTYGGQSYPPSKDTGPAPECRIEVSPRKPAAKDMFLHVLTATDVAVESVPPAQTWQTESEVYVQVGDWQMVFGKEQVAFRME
jgi:hypothetical protein